MKDTEKGVEFVGEYMSTGPIQVATQNRSNSIPTATVAMPHNTYEVGRMMLLVDDLYWTAVEIGHQVLWQTSET